MTTKDFMINYCENIGAYASILVFDRVHNKVGYAKQLYTEQSSLNFSVNNQKLYELTESIYRASDLRLIKSEKEIFDGFLKKMMILLPASISASDTNDIKATALLVGYLHPNNNQDMVDATIVDMVFKELETDVHKIESLNNVLYEGHSDCIEYLGHLPAVSME